MIEKLLSTCRIAGDVLQALCYALVIRCGGVGGFVTVKNWDYFDAVVGSYRDKRKGNTKDAIRLWEYPDLKPGEIGTVKNVMVYHSSLGWKLGVDDCSVVDGEAFKTIIEEHVRIAYPIYYACRRIEDINRERDQLTGMYTRGKFFMDMKGNILTSRKMNIPLWIMFIDLNNFKVVNDYFGHDVGDRVLRSIAQEIKSVIAGYGILYRLGGDEFVGVFVGTGEEKIKELARRVEAVTEQAPCGVFVNASAGIKYYIPEYGVGDQAVEEFLKESDKEMYNLKKNKRSVSIMCEKCHLHERKGAAV